MAKGPNLPSLYFDDGDDFIVIAHRGASAYYPENTMAAFEGAVAMDAEMIELDVLMSKDGVPVVFHDLALDDHTNGNGYIPQYTVEKLKKLDAGSWFDKKFADQRIPTLEEVLQFASGKIALNIEIKTEAVSDQVEGGVEQKSLELVKQYGMEKHVLFSSFDYRAVEHLKQLDPEVSVALLYNKHQSQRQLPHQQVGKFSADAFNCSFRQFSKKWSRNLKKHGIPHFIYTVNSKRKMKKLIKAGVSGIFTNKPDLLHRVKDNL
ncbi:glycerophosphodiester phosphodiesterase [Fodinibius halophilus]|uniref:GP-PDE domain-containing protein n=1 Tax=Fodinibius halophilus TaxID=1736908 RepID=A0A6M1TBC4_9BACT|nr:glycerophosphodiester phosphodiesterase family protein [Fodinibius halophilus]NGP89331.1 hypothetical protein [Fodinibius halophilus]